MVPITRWKDDFLLWQGVHLLINLTLHVYASSLWWYLDNLIKIKWQSEGLGSLRLFGRAVWLTRSMFTFTQIYLLRTFTQHSRERDYIFAIRNLTTLGRWWRCSSQELARQVGQRLRLLSYMLMVARTRPDSLNRLSYYVIIPARFLSRDSHIHSFT